MQEKTEPNIREKLQYLFEDFMIATHAGELEKANEIFREYQAVRIEQMDLRLK